MLASWSRVDSNLLVQPGGVQACVECCSGGGESSVAGGAAGRVQGGRAVGEREGRVGPDLETWSSG